MFRNSPLQHNGLLYYPLLFLAVVDCKLGDWTAWSSCSATCGKGTRHSVRDVEQEAQSGGKSCDNGFQPSTELLTLQRRSESCELESCPRKCFSVFL